MKENRSGKFTTNLYGESAYESFQLAPLLPNPPITIDAEMLSLFVNAQKSLF